MILLSDFLSLTSSIVEIFLNKLVSRTSFDRDTANISRTKLKLDYSLLCHSLEKHARIKCIMGNVASAATGEILKASLIERICKVTAINTNKISTFLLDYSS